ncbi:MAG: hypothetical protein FJ255_01185 [Phycisphaerae bacterium]|nr:hypothetical protein [Phycisphaerae bacterium]
MGLASLGWLVGVSLGVSSPEDAGVVRTEVEKVLGGMAAAVLAGDPEAYLKHVDHADPVFSKEQFNWAADLKKHVPVEFRMTLGEAGVTLVDGSARGELSLVWRMPGPPHAEGEEAEPVRERTVSWPARFVRGGSGWLYAGEVWHAHESPGVRVLHEDGLDQAAALVAELMPHVRDVVHEGFEVAPDDPLPHRTQEVKLYQSMAHLQASIYLSYTDSLGGWNEPGEAIKLLARPNTTRRSIENRLAHEYGHVATFEMGPHATDMPWWVLEGIANLAGEAATNTGSPNTTVKRWAKAGTLGNWAEMAAFDEKGRSLGRYVYAQGHHMVAYVTERFGRTRRNAWMRSMAQGATLDESSREALGLSFADLDAQWREDLALELARDEEAAAREPKTDPGSPVPGTPPPSPR